MLARLTVENYALIDRLDLNLSPSLNIITGETGAGKSILLGALSLLLGNRCDQGVIKDREKNCVIEGSFDIGGYGLEWFFTDNDLDYDKNTIIRRVITPAGKSRAYINDLPVQLITLKEFGSYLIDIHSQHQSLLIGNDNFRLGIVDTIANHNGLKEEFSKCYHSLRLTEQQLARLKDEADHSRRDEEWIRFQVEELQNARLEEGEQELLEGRLNELSNSEEIRNALSQTSSLLNNDETGVLVQLKTSEQALSKVSVFFPPASELSERIHSVIAELKDIESITANEYDRIDADPAKLEATERRLDLLYSLQTKHKVKDISELLEVQKEYERKLGTITHSQEAIEELKQRINTMREKAMELASVLSSNRRKAAKSIENHVTGMLARLGMEAGIFKVDIKELTELKTSGINDIEFLFSANKQIPVAPAAKIASGGEISRVMLALKSIVAKSGKLPTIIFDEIDTGVSGKIADVMGSIINELSDNMQVINITHLPQVASKGNTHFYVYKQDIGNTTTTSIRQLDNNERIQELAKMLSGSEVTDAAIKQAQLLLGL